MTVAENLAFPLEVRGMSRSDQEDRVKKILDLVELPQMAGRRPAQLSGGQQQRVAVARALVFEPDLVLMDEPLGALDKQLREQMQYEIKYIHENLGVTVVYVTHDQTEALTMSDRVAVFEDGVIQLLKMALFSSFHHLKAFTKHLKILLWPSLSARTTNYMVLSRKYQKAFARYVLMMEPYCMPNK